MDGADVKLNYKDGRTAPHTATITEDTEIIGLERVFERVLEWKSVQRSSIYRHQTFTSPMGYTTIASDAHQC